MGEPLNHPFIHFNRTFHYTPHTPYILGIAHWKPPDQPRGDVFLWPSLVRGLQSMGRLMVFHVLHPHRVTGRGRL